MERAHMSENQDKNDTSPENIVNPGSLELSHHTVLVVDDEKDARDLLKIALSADHFDIHCCTNAEEAMQLMAKDFPDLAILDVQMPGTTGIELCQWIKRNSGSNFVPVILLTCQNEISQKIHGLNCGADEYITKPFA